MVYLRFIRPDELKIVMRLFQTIRNRFKLKKNYTLQMKKKLKQKMLKLMILKNPLFHFFYSFNPFYIYSVQNYVISKLYILSVLIRFYENIQPDFLRNLNILRDK